MRKPYIWGLIAALFSAAIVSWYLYAHRAQFLVLNPAGPVALAERSVIITTVLLCAIVVVPVFAMLFIFAWRYRASGPHSKHRHTPELDHTDRMAELVWWLVPSVIIVFLGILAWQSSHALDPYIPLPGSSSITIEVVALDWKWLFIYPAQNIATVNLVEFPENTPLHFEISSDAPMNSFWIPQLGGQIMAMPGMTTQLNLLASRVGDFNGFSGNISGAGFAGMAFTARSVSQNDFDEWVRDVQTSQHALDTDSYRALVQPSEYNAVATYSPVDGSLYTDIIMRYMNPGNSMTQSLMPAMPGMEMEGATSTM